MLFRSASGTSRLASRAALIVVVACSVSLLAQQRSLTLDDIYGIGSAGRFSGTPVTGLTWMDDSHYLWTRDDNGAAQWLKVDAVSEKSEPLIDPEKIAAAFARLPGITTDEARRISRRRPVAFHPGFSGMLHTIADDLYYFDFRSGNATRLTHTPQAEEESSFSPDGRAVAFLRSSNLFVVDVNGQEERALTTDGGPELLNGKLDWVYQEEIYGRGNYRGYWWSPDSSRIAFLQLDEKPVPEYTIVDDIPYRPTVETWDYPKAGDPNPNVKLGIVGSAGGSVRWADTTQYSDFLIVNVAWTPDSRSAVFLVQDRRQTWLDLNLVDRDSGALTTILKETSKTWIEEPSAPWWLKDGSFLWLSERSGWKHLYHHKADGSLVRQVTNGSWELRVLHGMDQAGGWIFFSGTERSPIGRDVYRIKLDGTGMQRLSGPAGTHTARFSPGYSLYLNSWSDVTTPVQLRLHRGDGSEVRIIDANQVASHKEYRMSKPEFLQVKTRDGFVMEAMMIKPPDFDPSRKYPVYQFTYGGPHSQSVVNSWGGSEYMYHQLLAQQGVIVWLCDNRTASGKGAESTWPVYKNFGELELRDIEDGIAWLKQQPYVDGSRIGIHGWSYGGYITAYALTHSKTFAMGIAGGTVSDWRDYDTIYTERYMSTPQDNPEGYRKSSPRFAARDLSGQLLLIHGAIDDNVHPQNTLQFAYELQKAGKNFQLMLYPKSRHGISDPQLVRHMRGMMFDFVLKNLKVGT